MTNYFDDKQLYPLLFQNDFSKILSFLEKYGLNSVDRNGRSFLMNCIAEGKNDFAYKLIELGANLNHQDASGKAVIGGPSFYTSALTYSAFDSLARNRRGGKALYCVSSELFSDLFKCILGF